MKTRNLFASLLLIWIVALGMSAQAQNQRGLGWKPWNEWDRVTKSYVPIDSTAESRKDVLIAKAVLTPTLPPFIFVRRKASGYCGSGGCTLEVLAPEPTGTYIPFQQWIVDDIEIKGEQLFNGWHPIVLGNNTWVYENGQYILR